LCFRRRPPPRFPSAPAPPGQERKFILHFEEGLKLLEESSWLVLIQGGRGVITCPQERLDKVKEEVYQLCLEFLKPFDFLRRRPSGIPSRPFFVSIGVTIFRSVISVERFFSSLSFTKSVKVVKVRI